MNALPLELHEQIFTYLLPTYDQKRSVTVPVSTKPQRADIYNVRLTNRCLYRNSSSAFIKLVEDVPTKCTESSLQSLSSLVSILEISNRLTCLTLNARTVFLEPDNALIEPDIQDRDEWLREELQERLLSIINKAPNIRHLICTLDSGDFGYPPAEPGSSSQYDVWLDMANMVDPFQIIHDTLQASSLHKNLESLSLLVIPPHGHITSRLPRHTCTYLPYPHLQHLTLSPTTYSISHFRISGLSQLKTLHTILDEDTNHHWLGDGSECSIFTSLQEYIISGRSNENLEIGGILQLIEPVVTQNVALQRLVVRDLSMLVDIGYDVPEFKGNGRIEKLVFENVQVCWTDEITNSGPSEPKSLEGMRSVLSMLRRYADEVCVMWRANGGKAGGEVSLPGL